MEEVLRVESFLAGWHISAHTAARVLVILLGIALAGNPAMREMTQDFLNAPIVPKAKTEGSASAGSKQEGKVWKPETAMKEENELAFRNPVSDDEVGLDVVLAEVSVPETPLQLPHLSDEADPYLAEAWMEMEVPMPDIPFDNQIVTMPFIPDMAEPGKTEEKLPDLTVTEEIIAEEPLIPEIAKQEPQGSDPVVKVPPSEDFTVVEEITPEPVAPEPITPELITPEEITPEPITPEEITPEPITPEPVAPEQAVPEPGTDVPDMDTDDILDAGENNGETEVATSCFLLDDAGMLYGFLPEYAEIPDGCLTLPEECTGIRSGAFSGCGAEIYELYIPAGVTTIEEGALVGLNLLEWIDVDYGNPVYTSESGVLFDSTMSTLLAFPSGWTTGYAVPPSVTRIAGRAFENTSISLIDARKCGSLSFDANAFGASGGSGITIMTAAVQQETQEEDSQDMQPEG